MLRSLGLLCLSSTYTCVCVCVLPIYFCRLAHLGLPNSLCLLLQTWAATEACGSDLVRAQHFLCLFGWYRGMALKDTGLTDLLEAWCNKNMSYCPGFYEVTPSVNRKSRGWICFSCGLCTCQAACKSCMMMLRIFAWYKLEFPLFDTKKVCLMFN